MSFNFSELQQKADRVLHNADEFVRRYVQFALAPAQDISVQYYDQNGNLQTTTFPNRQKLVNQFFNDINSAMMRTYYVDWDNGNDNNDGTQQRPFKTLQKAIDNVPVGGSGTIHVIGNYELQSNVHIIQRYVVLRFNSATLTTSWYTQSNLAFLYGFRVSKSGFLFIATNDGGYFNIVVPPKPQNAGGTPSWGDALFNILDVEYGVIVLRPQDTTACTITVNDGKLFGVGGSGSVHIHLFKVGGGEKELRLNNAYLLRLTDGAVVFKAFLENVYVNNTHAVYRNNPQGSFQMSSMFAGVIRHSSGIPLNVLSNIPL